MDDDPKVTLDDAVRQTKLARIRAIRAVLDRHFAPLGNHLIATEIYAAYHDAEGVSADDCDDVDPKFGRGVRFYGHEPFVSRETIAKTPDELARLTNPQPIPHMGEGWVSYEDHQYGGHYTTEYEDKRRPDGSHPWDF